MVHALSFVCLALLILGNVLEIQAAPAAEKIAIGYAAINARITPLWAAIEQGFFTKNDVDVELIFVRGAPTLNAAMLSGDLQVGYTGGTAVMGAAVGGADLKILAVLTNKVTYDLVARSGIRNLEDLRGKQIGVTSIGGTNWMGTILGLERLGLDPNRDKINFIVAGDDSVRTQALLAGAIDATAVDGVYSKILREKGLPVLAEFSALKIPITSVSMVFRNAFIQKNPRIAENVLKAVVEGIIWGISPLNQGRVIDLISKRLRITRQEAEEGYKDMLLGLERRPFPSVEGLKNIQRLMKSRNPRMAELKVEDLIDASFMRKLDESGFINRLFSSYGAKSQ
ncbi:ABC transporter substrate-binding protein [bacterium]|nr:MAG: ABC transporter substrate-binding protein [bacterium]